MLTGLYASIETYCTCARACARDSVIKCVCRCVRANTIETSCSPLNHSDNNDADNDTRSNYVPVQPHEPQPGVSREGGVTPEERGGVRGRREEKVRKVLCG